MESGQQGQPQISPPEAPLSRSVGRLMRMAIGAYVGIALDQPLEKHGFRRQPPPANLAQDFLIFGKGLGLLRKMEEIQALFGIDAGKLFVERAFQIGAEFSYGADSKKPIRPLAPRFRAEPGLAIEELIKQVSTPDGNFDEVKAREICVETRKYRYTGGAKTMLSTYLEILENFFTRYQDFCKTAPARRVFEDSTGAQPENPTTQGQFCVSPMYPQWPLLAGSDPAHGTGAAVPAIRQATKTPVATPATMSTAIPPRAPGESGQAASSARSDPQTHRDFGAMFDDHAVDSWCNPLAPLAVASGMPVADLGLPDKINLLSSMGAQGDVDGIADAQQAPGLPFENSGLR
jgi:hypothetical protein